MIDVVKNAVLSVNRLKNQKKILTKAKRCDIIHAVCHMPCAGKGEINACRRNIGSF